jgi:integrase
MKGKTMKKSKRVQLRGAHGRRVNMKFPPCTTKEEVGTFKRVARRLVQCQLGNLAFFPQDIAYVQSHGKKMANKLRLLGVSFDQRQEKSDEAQLGNYVSRVIAAKTGESERKLSDVARRMERFFGRTKDLREITKTDAESFAKWLIETEGLAEHSTVRRTLGYVSQIMARAIDDGLLQRNPFSGKEFPKAVRADPKKWWYISPEETMRIWNAVQTEEDQVRFVLLRYLGLRAPSEINLLTWRDVDWEQLQLSIYSPKLRHDKNQGRRRCPISHPDVLRVLRRAYEKRQADDAPIVPPITHTSLTKRVKQWLGAAGLNVWPQLLVNFRRSAVTDACSYLPSHVVSEYYGHSEAISYSNYRMTVATHAQACATAPSLIEDSIPKPSDEEAA